jgi:hypothetical protein
MESTGQVNTNTGKNSHIKRHACILPGHGCGSTGEKTNMAINPTIYHARKQY